jgi:hypothetical protein
MSGAGFSADEAGRVAVDPGGERIGRLVDLLAGSETGAVTVKCGQQLARRERSVKPGEDAA